MLCAVFIHTILQILNFLYLKNGRGGVRGIRTNNGFSLNICFHFGYLKREDEDQPMKDRPRQSVFLDAQASQEPTMSVSLSLSVCVCVSQLASTSP